MATASRIEEAGELSSPGLGDKLAPVADFAREHAGKLWHPITLATVFALAYLALAGLYFQSERTLVDLESQIAGGRAVLAAPQPNQDELNSRVQFWEATLRSAIDARLPELPDDAIVASTLAAAADSGIRVVSAGMRADVTQTINGTEYHSQPYAVRAEGSLEEVQAFLTIMESGRIAGFEIDSAIITLDDGVYSLSVTAMVRSEFGAVTEQVDTTQ